MHSLFLYDLHIVSCIEGLRFCQVNYVTEVFWTKSLLMQCFLNALNKSYYKLFTVISIIKVKYDWKFLMLRFMPMLKSSDTF